MPSRLTALILFALLLAGCGYKTDLTLPEEEEEQARATVPALANETTQRSTDKKS